MKTLLKISTDYYSSNSCDEQKELVANLLDELDVMVCVRNNQYLNIAEQSNKDKEDYKNSLKLSAVGYSQSEWQEYTILFNDEETKKPAFQMLINELKATFTHKHDYIMEKYEYVEVEGKKFVNPEPFDLISISITDIEFPEKEDVLTVYQSEFGVDYDAIEINID